MDMAEASRERRKWLKSKGYCILCGCEKARPGRVTCASCEAKSKEKRKAAYWKKREAGICVTMGCNKPAANGGVRCEEHRERERLRIAEMRRKQREDKHDQG